MKSKPTPEIYFQVSQSWVSKNTGTPQIKKKMFLYIFFCISKVFYIMKNSYQVGHNIFSIF